MGFDFLFSFRFADETDGISKIDMLLNGADNYSSLDPFTRIMLLNNSFASDALKDYARSGDMSKFSREIRDKRRTQGQGEKTDGGYKAAMKDSNLKGFVKENRTELKALGLIRPEIKINLFPKNSFFLQFKIRLAKDYISRDDEDFYIIDNPVRKDKVFKIPMVAATSWKGNLRWMMKRRKEDKKLIDYLFGPDGSEESLYQGSLNFFTTFFNEIGIDLINPHSRKTKTPTAGPIILETIPKGSEGWFSLLYFNQQIGASYSPLDSVVQSVLELMTVYGFSAKRKAGYGIVAVDNSAPLDGRLLMPHSAEMKFSSFNALSKLPAKIGQINQ